MNVKNVCVLKIYRPISLFLHVLTFASILFPRQTPTPSLFLSLLIFLHFFNLFCVLAPSVITYYILKPFLFLFFFSFTSNISDQLHINLQPCLFPMPLIFSFLFLNFLFFCYLNTGQSRRQSPPVQLSLTRIITISLTISDISSSTFCLILLHYISSFYSPAS